jgi:outer membrane protein OmpA-like peptidoglycan-associated protein
MANSIMDSILAMVTPEMQRSLAARLGESPQSVHGGLGAAAAATLDGLASKVGDPRFVTETLNFISGARGQNVYSNLCSIASEGPTGATAELLNRFLPMVFGSQQSEVASAIAQQYGLSASSGMDLLRVAVPLLLAFFVKAQSAGTLDANTLGNMLRTQAPNLRSYLPSGLLGSAAGVVRDTPRRETGLPPAGDGAEAAVPPRWLVPAAIAGALVLALLAIRALNSQPENAPAVATVTAEAINAGTTVASNATIDAATAAEAALGDMMKVKLPDGSELNVPARGVEARLVKFLNGSAAVSDAVWFDFDRLLFDTGKATLQSASQEQLTNIATILKAYPQVTIRIGGYTDNNGDPPANRRLSQERANHVVDELVKLGIDPARMSARGYGEQDPVADNSTEAGRQKNRRISLRVTDKQASL